MVCGIIINGNKRIILAKRSAQMSHAGKWEFPGGKVKENESYRQALEREILEELGLKIKPLQELEAIKWDYGDRSIELIPIVCQPLSEEIYLKEHETFGWFSFTEMMQKELLEADVEILPHLKAFVNKI